NVNSNNTNSPLLSQEQLIALKFQILAFKLISRNIPMPPQLEQAMFNPEPIQGIMSMQDLSRLISEKPAQSNHSHSHLDHASCRIMKNSSMMDARITEGLEIKQREDRERKERQKHTNLIQSIGSH
ncbi:18219_t:CDS:2, partial [Entrophospora sp. SA101]